ncbi:MAG: DNA methyltransferase [Methanosarcinales archaeon]|nr:DNA methyltransferase [Methanosarcinales archaeon]
MNSSGSKSVLVRTNNVFIYPVKCIFFFLMHNDYHSGVNINLYLLEILVDFLPCSSPESQPPTCRGSSCSLLSLLSSSESASLFFLIALRESRKVSVLLTNQIHKGNYRGNWSPYIPRNLILRYTEKNDTVLDQMAGSGTTLVECKLLQRNAIGVDINPDAVMVARNRLDFSYTPLDEHTAPQRTQSQCNIFLCVLCALCGELNNENQPHSFFSSPAAPFWFTLPGCPSRSAPPALVVWGAGRRFSILPAGFGCKVGIDAWVGGWRKGARN